MEIDLIEQQVELLLGEIDVDHRQRERVKGEIPGRKPRVFPFVRHRKDVVADHVEPFAVAYDAGRPMHRIGAVLFEPFIGVEKEILLAPQHPGIGLTQHIGHIRSNA